MLEKVQIQMNRLWFNVVAPVNSADIANYIIFELFMYSFATLAFTLIEMFMKFTL